MAQMILSMNNLKSTTLEFYVRQFQMKVVTCLTREAVYVDIEQLEETNTMPWVLSKVLVDHTECWLKHSIQDCRYLRRQ